jgi:hypothetical protein
MNRESYNRSANNSVKLSQSPDWDSYAILQSMRGRTGNDRDRIHQRLFQYLGG